VEPDDKPGSSIARKACVACGQEFNGNVTLCPDDGTLLTPLAQQPIIGAVIGDRYEIMEVIGDGGMGMVFKAKHLLMKRAVAIKMLHPHLVSSAAALKRFQKEAEALSALNHPNILTVFDFGLTAQGNPFLVMDFLEGDTLAGLLGDGEALEPERAVNIFLQTCSGLAHAHQKGVIHRDLKPANLMLIDYDDQPDFVKILDFGIAKVVSEETTGLTQTGDVFGSPLYMSPEQCRGQVLDLRTDIYSLGCVMYRTLSGVCPVSGSDALECMFKQVSELPPAFSDMCPERGVPEALEAVVFKALSKDPGERFQSMSELRASLENLRDPSAPRYMTREFTPTMSQPFPAMENTTPPAATDSGKAAAASGVADVTANLKAEAATTSGAESGEPAVLPPAGSAGQGMKLKLAAAAAAAVAILGVVAWGVMQLTSQRGVDPSTELASAGSGDGVSVSAAMTNGQKAYEAGDYNLAAKSWQQAVSAAEKSNSQTDLAAALDKLASIDYDLGKLTSARDVAKRAYNLKEKLYGRTSAEVADTLVLLGRIDTAAENNERAELELKGALDIRRDTYGEDSLPYGDSLAATGQYYLKRGDYPKAIALLTGAMGLTRKIMGPTDLKLAKIENDLGQAYELSGNNNKAEELFEKALTIRSVKLSDNDPALAESLSTMGTLLTNKKDYKKAEKLLKQALAIQLKTFGPESVFVAKNQYNLGVLMYNQGNFEQAQQYLQEALKASANAEAMSSPSQAQIKALLEDCAKRLTHGTARSQPPEPKAKPAHHTIRRPAPRANEPQNFHW